MALFAAGIVAYAGPSLKEAFMTKNIEDKAEGMMNEAKGRVKDAVGG